MDLELISFKICPFVQRSVITLRYKQAPYKITYIDLGNPPDWFQRISPFGKVPVLKVDGETTLFESAVINEFIDDVTPGQLAPQDPLTRALNRSWIEVGSVGLMDFFQSLMAESEAAYEEKRQGLVTTLGRLEEVLGEGPFFNGSDPALIDFALAPLFQRIELLNSRADYIDLNSWPKLADWSRALLAMPAVEESLVEDFDSLFFGFVKQKGGAGAQRFL